jgi:hemerythrin-like metal-binding protein
MSIFISLEEYKTGHEEIDRQHYFLFEMANRIFHAHHKQSAVRLGNMFLRFLNDYFTAEEFIMQPYNYPGYAKHVQEHKQLLNQLREILINSENGEWVPNDFIDFIRTQLMVHIVEKDMKLC